MYDWQRDINMTINHRDYYTGIARIESGCVGFGVVWGGVPGWEGWSCRFAGEL